MKYRPYILSDPKYNFLSYYIGSGYYLKYELFANAKIVQLQKTQTKTKIENKPTTIAYL